jgi:hypothetical protein
VLTEEDMKQHGLHGLVEPFFSWGNLRNGVHPLQEKNSFQYTDHKKCNREGGCLCAAGIGCKKENVLHFDYCLYQVLDEGLPLSEDVNWSNMSLAGNVYEDVSTGYQNDKENQKEHASDKSLNKQSISKPLKTLKERIENEKVKKENCTSERNSKRKVYLRRIVSQ